MIFMPGFSTAEKITGVSGRGVGMDVVRTNIEKIGGTIELKSTVGQGSSFIIKIPLTLAIVSALIVECGGERFAIPQISVVELVRASAKSETSVEMINEAPVLRLRDRLLPLVSLADLLKLNDTKQDLGEEVFIVVTQVGAYSFGIVVDRVFDTEEIVVKPVARILRDIPYYSGNTILGDGSVIMILDPNGIAGTTSETSTPQSEADAALAKDVTYGSERISLLVFRAGDEELKAVPLALVARLEEIEVDTIEYSRSLPMVQYRGHLMPLVMMGNSQMRESGRQPILVFTDRDRSMGLVVDQIVDIVEDTVNVELAADQEGLIGSAVIGGKATGVIDAGHYLTQAFHDWFGRSDGEAAGFEGGSENKLLLVDDSAFFRNLMAPQLAVAGFLVTTAENAQEALELREGGHHFDVIVSDIEMPGMNGFEFAQAVHETPVWKDTPMVALSAHTAESDMERGREAGFSDHVAKFDRAALIEALNHTVQSSHGKGDRA